MFHAPRGTHDLLPDAAALRQHIIETARHEAALAGYRPIEPPTFENADLFARGVGEATDIVEKEMYVFEDRGGEPLSLIPEPTPAICRAYLEHGMGSRPQPVRLFTTARVFRYNRPQLGRLRQFSQFDCEAIGSPAPSVDAELITLQWRLYEKLGLGDIELHLGSIDDVAPRRAYLERLKEYYRPLSERLSDDSQRRLERNPLRVLDSNDGKDQEFRDGAPTLVDDLSEAAAEHFEIVKRVLTEAGVPFIVDPLLVRGLDYYNRTVWELVPKGDGRAQSSIGGGGRYDGLVETLGGPATAAVGFGTGLERIILEMKRQEVNVPEAAPLDVFVVHAGEEAGRAAIRAASGLRAAGLATLVGESGRSFKSQMRRANGSGAQFAVIIGEDEVARGAAAVKDLRGEGAQEEVALGDLGERVAARAREQTS